MSIEALERDDACQHEDWQAKATMFRDREADDGPVTGWSVEVTMTCVACLTPMQWITQTGGCSRFEPTASDDGLELRVPCRPFDVGRTA